MSSYDETFLAMMNSASKIWTVQHTNGDLAEANEQLSVPVQLDALRPVDGAEKAFLLKELEAKPQSDLRDEIIRNTHRGWYADMCLHFDCPATALALHLQQAGFDDMAKKAWRGEYDHLH